MEKAEQKNITRQNQHVLRWLWRAVKGKRRYVGYLLGLQAAISLGSVAFSLLFREMVDRAVSADRPGFSAYLTVVILLTLIQAAMRAANRSLDEYTRAAVENTLKGRLFSTLLRMDYAAVTAVHSGEWMNRLTSDTVVIAQGVAQILPNVGGMLIRMTGALAAIILLQPVFGAVVIPAGLVLILVTRLLRPALKRLHSRIQQSDGALRVLLQERLENMLIIRSFSRQMHTDMLARERMEAHKTARMKRSNLSNLSQTGFALAIQGMYLLGAAFCGVGIMNGTVTFGTLTAVLQLISQLQSPFSGISSYVSQWYAMTASAERIMEAEALPADPGSGQNNEQESLCLYREEFSGLRVDGLSFAYTSQDGEKPVTLRDVSMKLKKGEYVALAGDSGCGKSTLLKLLLCLYRPDAGEITLQSTDGQARSLTAADRGLFAYVPQGNQLMSGTIRQSVAFFDEEKMTQEQRLWQALQVACADEFVRKLPQGLDTQLGEHGCGLSEGQLQRLAVARAVFSGRPILLLDEATSALDEPTEAQMLHNLRTMTDCTVLIVTHRPQVCASCDRVVRLSRFEPEKECEE